MADAMKVIANLQQRIGALTVDLAATQVELDDARTEAARLNALVEQQTEAAPTA